MSQHKKALERVTTTPTPSDIHWDELTAVLTQLGYKVLKSKRGGSRRKFHNPETGHIINLHEPHPDKIVAKCYIKQVVDSLKENGLIS